MRTISAPPPTERQHGLPSAHPMDSSRLFAALLSLVKESDGEQGFNPELSLISLPVLRRLLSAIHFRDAGILKHSRRVGLISVGIASRLGWEDEDLRVIEIASLMHDIGKIGVPDHILLKPGRLSPDEAEFIAMHHRVAIALLQACHVHTSITEIVAQAHGVGDDSVPGCPPHSLGARILAVADAYDSLTTRQSFRAPYDRWEALQILEEQSGKEFDRNVVAALGRWLDSTDAAILADERAAEVSIQVNAPVDSETRLGAMQLVQFLNHLYLLESLYDAFYFVDSQRNIAIWSSGAAKLFNRPANEVLGKKWSRHLVGGSSASIDQLESVFLSGEITCNSISVQCSNRDMINVNVQNIPIFGAHEKVIGVVELFCNETEPKRFRNQYRSLQIAATRDALTGVLNRGELERRLNEVYDEWTAHSKGTFSVIFMDLDHFKSINDQLSHAIGDRVLIECSRLLQDELYSGETVGRYGGEEFIILCPETNAAVAIERSERLRRTLSSTRFADRHDLRVTASFGVAEIQPGESLESVISRADAALYEAKNNGRNRTAACKSLANQNQIHAVGQAIADSNIHTSTFKTSVVSDMLHLKLIGFVDAIKAKIVAVTPGEVILQTGGHRLFSAWRKSALDRLPVKLTITLVDPPLDAAPGHHMTTTVRVQVVPVGKCHDPGLLKQKAKHIFDQLRSHLIAQ
ncbi:diguanylate cyclase [Planctomicrobium sp. SH668]|uniref:diguanylate cyclase n=1 Tax=Planctomicrobium sp. SH668 TaxID=3448126 RepID=UPI003F5B7A30